jgi:hypothetical protein
MRPRLRVRDADPLLWQDVWVSEHNGYPGAPPGWYPDPAGGPGQRWWDGYAWTDATVLPQQPPPPPSAHAEPRPGPAPEVAPWAVASAAPTTSGTTSLVDNEQRIVPFARIAVVMPAVYYLVNLVVQRVNADQLLALGHQFRVDWHDAQNGVTPPPYHGSSGLGPVNLLVGVVTVVAVVNACIWQHRAASAGRSLGFASRRSPAWGVGSWFVPIVNLWMPYSAIRDCLPPDHPHRARVLHWWIAWIAAASLSAAAGVCALFSTGAALVVSIPAALACLAVIAWAPGIVTGIAAAHREAMANHAAGVGAMRG